MARQNIPFTLIDESVVQYGFRVLMSGYQSSLFDSNPVMLLMHSRAMSGMLSGGLTEDVLLPLGKWYDVKVQGEKLVGYPEFDDDDEMAVKVEGKVIKGYLNACSVALVPLAVSDDPELKLPGQSGVTITKWEIQECSIVDIPNCRNSLAIRNSAGKSINLSAGNDDEVLQLLNGLIPSNINIMDKKLLCATLGLPESASEAEITAKLSALKNDASTVITLTAEKEALQTAKTNAELQVTQLQAAQETAKIEKLVDDAIAVKKLAAGDRDKYLKLAKADFATTQELITGMKPYESIEGGLNGNTNLSANNAELQELLKLSSRELYMQGKFERLKQLDLAAFKVRHLEYFKVPYIEPKA